jgi:drug/metabolite transporter (DMT)-like permease
VVTPAAPRGRIAAALVTVWIVWGSTYLAIAVAVETLPPFLMAGVRFVLAGGLLFGFARLRGATVPDRRQWGSALLVGTLLLLLGNGLVCWAERWVPTGLASLIIASTPLWMALFPWLAGGVRPGGRVMAGIALGMAGIVVLVSGRGAGTGGGHPWTASLAVLVACLAWAGGSLWSRRLPQAESPLMAAAAQMLAGGGLLLLAGAVLGERVAWTGVSHGSVAAFAYLVVVGSLLGYGCYVYLLRSASPTLVSTYAFVNPVVAVGLGAALRGEPLTPRLALGAALVVPAIVLIVTGRRSSA